MRIQAVLSDFDGTQVTKDILDVVCGIVGKEQESRRLNEDFRKGKSSGVDSAMARINFLHDVPIDQIKEKLKQNDYLMPGAEELFKYLNYKKITTILYSGNIIPILNYYKERLGIGYVVGSRPKMNGDKIDSISIEDFLGGENFKLEGCKLILEKLNIKQSDIIAIGDSPSDKAIFEYAAKSIAIQPKGGIEKFADYQVNDLYQAREIISSLLI